ncbi:prepilin peptidase [Salinibacterium sp. G-O1]|uniref:prepilin peptidase n=1 Tax=Salinibacterium sp. G-O1 TaxID=3046208 RepID=UPI0024B9B66A|nr:A24 family peptidase [Salinibacterium sp. G-O1]MDJ0334130.1 prepilin peptidase [Salinibacterium sp. G-O1]
MASLTVALVGAFGLLIGSFLNVVVYRVPARQSIVSPPSACPQCATPIRRRDNVPVLSWLILRGRCRDCQAPISRRYPLVELATGLFFAAVAAWFTLVWLPAAAPATTSQQVGAVVLLVAFLYLAAVSVALALIDLDHRILPNSIVLPSYLVGAVLLAAAGLLTADYSALLSSAIGAAAMFGTYFLLALIYPRGMGMGDVKLAGVLGLFLGYLGWQELVVGAFAAFFLGGIFSIALILMRRASRTTAIPFGPWMLLGAWVGIFFGTVIMGAYLQLFGII